MITPYDRPTITVRTYETIHGAPLRVPLAVVDIDSLQTSQRLDAAQDFHVDVLGFALPGDPASNSGPWRPCEPGQPIFVEATAGHPDGCLYISSSANGVDEVDSVCPGVLQVETPMGLRFTTTQPYYRVCVAPARPCAVVLLSQQRT